MKNRMHLILLLISSLIIFSACKREIDPTPNPDMSTEDAIVSQFVYDGMSLFYRWADEMRYQKPSATEKPKDYFYSILNPTDSKKKWSFITDNVEALIASFDGEPEEFGFSVAFAPLDIEHSKFIAVVEYVYPNSPADKAGLKRADLISKIDNEVITKNNYMKFFQSKTAIFTLAKGEKSISITPAHIKADPVLYTKIFEINGKKIAYLFYTGFTYPFNNSLYKAFSQFKQAGVSDLILDLRYNGGGAIASANYLCSLFLPEESVRGGKVLSSLDYNSFLNNQISNKSTKLGTYDKKEFPNPLDANLNLKKIYIIATHSSYSASELTLFCSRKYAEIVHIGSKTGGKYTASWTIHAFDNKIGQPTYLKLSEREKAILKNWALQPIVAIYTNADGKTFADTDGLIPQYEVYEGNVEEWKQLGDPQDRLLGTALSLITGAAIPKIAGTKDAVSIGTMEEMRDPRISKNALILEREHSSVIPF